MGVNAMQNVKEDLERPSKLCGLPAVKDLPPPPTADLTAHTGLRGLMALHVAVFHFLMGRDLFIGGNAHMPFFFLLSGFALATVYGDTQIRLSSFYRNRAARILPLFYLCSLVVVPLTFVGHGTHPDSFWRA